MVESKTVKKSINLQVSCHRLYHWSNSWKNLSKFFLSGDSDTVNSLEGKGDYEAKLLQFDIDRKRVAIFTGKTEVAEKVSWGSRYRSGFFLYTYIKYSLNKIKTLTRGCSWNRKIALKIFADLKK